MRRQAFTLPKDPGLPNEDAWAFNRLAHCYALSDGASTCYAGRAWARTLVRLYTSSPGVGPDWLARARDRFNHTAAPQAGDWLGRMAFDRGNFATLLGITLHPDRLEGIVIGDTILVIETPFGRSVHPPMSPEDFLNNPVLLSSHAGLGAFPGTADAFADAHTIVQAPEGGWGGCRIMALTDALALWAISGTDADGNRFARLANLRDASAFATLVTGEIGAGRMRRDDATVLIIEL